MNRQSVREAYKRIQPSQAEKDRMLKNILSTASEEPPQRKDATMKPLYKKPVMIAAIVGLMIFLMGCAVVAMNLQELKVGEYTPPAPDASQEGTAPEEPNAMISLQGFAGTANYLAAKEWNAFLDTYDVAAAALEADQNGFLPPEAYDAYECYNQEMIDKLNEICETYGLKLLGSIQMADNVQGTYNAVGIRSIISQNTDAQADVWPGYYYSDGTFQVEGEMGLNGEWPYRAVYQFRRVMKQSFDAAILNVGDMDGYDQWVYTMQDGTQVLLANNGEKGLIIVDKDDCFVTVNVLGVVTEETYYGPLPTERGFMEVLAETFDFSFTPRAFDPAVAQADQQALEDAQAEYEAQLKAAEDYLHQPDFATYVSNRLKDLRKLEELEGRVLVANAGYTFFDIDGNGEEELLLGSYGVSGKEGSFSEAITMKDGMTDCLYRDSNLYLCENDVLENYVSFDGFTAHTYWKRDENNTFLGYLEHDEAKQQWMFNKNGAYWDDDGIISEKEAQAIIDSYVRMPIPEMKPLTEFPVK